MCNVRLFSNCMLAGVLAIVCLAGGIAQSGASAAGQSEPPPFVDDPAVSGTWVSVDFVPSIDQFVPGQKSWKEDLYLTDISFYPGGKCSDWWRWSKGYVWDSREKDLCRYQLKDIGGTQYMFLEWVNSDVTKLGREPFYYVLVRGKAVKTVPDMAPLAAVISIGSGLLFIIISLPLVFGMIPMNNLYGFRLRKAFLSHVLWYEINAYGGKQFILWSVIMMVFDIAAIFLLKGTDYAVATMGIAGGSVIVFPGIATLLTLIHVARITPPSK
jgi:hypothetical protein